MHLRHHNNQTHAELLVAHEVEIFPFTMKHCDCVIGGLIAYL